MRLEQKNNQTNELIKDFEIKIETTKLNVKSLKESQPGKF